MLEAELGIPLFLRTTRKLTPAPEAQDIYQKARHFLEAYEEMRAIAGQKSPELVGRLSVSLPSSLGRNLLMPIMADFVRDHPQVDLDLHLSDRQVNLIEDGTEIAIRVGDLDDSAMRARFLCRLPRFAVASPDYLSIHPTPTAPSDVQDHVCIGYAGFGELSNWIFEGEMGRHVVKVNPKIRLDDADAMLEMALTGVGIAVLPGWLATPPLRKGVLERILPDFTIPSMPAQILYVQNTTPSPRARMFISHMLANRDRLFDVIHRFSADADARPRP